MVVAILAREFAVSALRSFAAAEQIVIPAGLSRQDQDRRPDRLDLAAHHLQQAGRVLPPGADLALGGDGRHPALGLRVLRALSAPSWAARERAAPDLVPPPRVSGLTSRRPLERLMLFAGRRHRLVFVVFILVVAGSAALASRLRFDPDVLHLLPTNEPGGHHLSRDARAVRQRRLLRGRRSGSPRTRRSIRTRPSPTSSRRG